MQTNLENLSGSSEFVVRHFLANNLQSTVFKNDAKQAKKLKGIQDAVKQGYLATRELPLELGVKVYATSKLMDLYQF